MFTVTVSDHVMIAHSLKGDIFGPARSLHGATYVVEAEFRSRHIDASGVVLDIGKARRILREMLADLDYRNLDDHPDFQGVNTTTEALARAIFHGLAGRIRDGALDIDQKQPQSPPESLPESLKVILRESPVAWASFEGRLDPDGDG